MLLYDLEQFFFDYSRYFFLCIEKRRTAIQLVPDVDIHLRAPFPQSRETFVPVLQICTSIRFRTETRVYISHYFFFHIPGIEIPKVVSCHSFDAAFPPFHFIKRFRIRSGHDKPIRCPRSRQLHLFFLQTLVPVVGQGGEGELLEVSFLKPREPAERVGSNARKQAVFGDIAPAFRFGPKDLASLEHAHRVHMREGEVREICSFLSFCVPCLWMLVDHAR